ncbi:MAG: glycosyltransferase family 4 protein [Methanomicrobiales archaeon]|nr:glycosyltransferase family 4 protein [Methanomicrobiales archaeon]
MKILLVSTQDYIHHPLTSRHHYIFEELALRHEIHVPHFHVSRGKTRTTRLTVHEATLFPCESPLLHYTLNAPYQYHVFSRILDKNDIDIVVAGHVLAGTSVITAARRRRIPVVFDLKDWLPDSAAAYYHNPGVQNAIRRGVWAITRYNLARSTRITTVSPGLVRKLGQFGFTASLITNGVDTDRFKPLPPSIREKLGIPRDAFVLGFAGSIERWYALDTVIRTLPDILQKVPNAHILIVGGSLFTGYADELRRVAVEAGVQDRVTFTGLVPYNDLPSYIAGMDVGLIPLSPPQWVDIALPNKFFEYSACGKPILSTPIPDMVAIGGPHLFIYRDYRQFVELVRAIAADPHQFILDFSGYSWKKKAQEFEILLQDVLANPLSGSSAPPMQ